MNDLSDESDHERTGNTNIRPAPKHQLVRWCFTLKAEAIDHRDLWSMLNEITSDFTFQIEKGNEGDYIHFQGVFALKERQYFEQVKNHFPRAIHLEPCRDWFKSITYCSKDDSRVSGPWSKYKRPLKCINKLRPWQDNLRNILLTEPDDRTIHWYWDTIGGTGKSSFCRYMILNHNALYITNGKTSDIAFTIKDNTKIILCDLSRSMEERLNYGVLEQCKNGLIFSGKYESTSKIIDPPHIVVFANFKPDKSKMSIDRWDIICLD